MPKNSKLVTCGNCRRSVSVPDPNEGHPYGWYTVSVNVPAWFNPISGKPYRWIGLFCSVGCLVAHEEKLLSMRELAEQAYAAE